MKIFPDKFKAEDTIHLRAVRYGYDRPNGFSYEGIKEHYRRRKKEWEIVDEFLREAKNNKEAGLNRVTPYVLLQGRDGDIKNSVFILSYEAYFNYLEYLELIEARESASRASWTAIIAIIISICSMGIAAYFSYKQLNSPTKIDPEQFRELIQVAKNDNLSVKIDDLMEIDAERFNEIIQSLKDIKKQQE